MILTADQACLFARNCPEASDERFNIWKGDTIRRYLCCWMFDAAAAAESVPLPHWVNQVIIFSPSVVSCFLIFIGSNCRFWLAAPYPHVPHSASTYGRPAIQPPLPIRTKIPRALPKNILTWGCKYAVNLRSCRITRLSYGHHFL